MSALAISLVAFACIFGGTLLGMFLRTILPGHHVSDESKDAVKLGIGYDRDAGGSGPWPADRLGQG